MWAVVQINRGQRTDVSSCVILVLRVLNPKQSEQGSLLQIPAPAQVKRRGRGLSTVRATSLWPCRWIPENMSARRVSDIEKCLSGTGSND